MFTHIPRTHLLRTGAVVGTVALTAGLTLVPLTANADEVSSSYASGQFLSGSLLGGDLADVVELAAAEAYNNGTQSRQTSKDPLRASVVQTIDVNAPGGVQLDLGDVIDAGAVNQYAQAEREGVSMGSSGAIGDDGAIGVGEVGSGAAGDLSLDLQALLGGEFASSVADLQLSLEAVAAQADGVKQSARGDYTLAGAVLTFSSPAISDLTGKVYRSLDVVDQKLLDMGGDDGILGDAVDQILDPLLGVIGSSADVQVTVSTDLRAAVQSLLDGTYGDGGVSFDLQTGEVSVDLETLLGGDLNDLPVNTELLTDAVITTILNSITQTVATLADQIVDRVELALNDAQVEVHADLSLLTDAGTIQQQECSVVDVPIVGDILGGGPGGLLGGLFGGGSSGITQGIIGYTTETVCKLVDTVLPDLQSTVMVDIEGSVDEILDRVAARAEASISLLGGTVNTALDIELLLDSLADGLSDGLFDGDGAVTELVDALNTNLVNPAVTGLLGDTGIGDLLRDIVSVRVNVQQIDTVPQGRVFTQTAVRVSVLPGSESLATVNVASASVGPNVTRIVDPGCQVNCGPGGPGDPGDPGDNGTTPAGNDRLAYTGMGIATLIAVILALLAAGAYLAREGYRRNHPRSLS